MSLPRRMHSDSRGDLSPFGRHGPVPRHGRRGPQVGGGGLRSAPAFVRIRRWGVSMFRSGKSVLFLGCPRCRWALAVDSRPRRKRMPADAARVSGGLQRASNTPLFRSLRRCHPVHRWTLVLASPLGDTGRRGAARDAPFLCSIVSCFRGWDDGRLVLAG